MNDTPPYHGLYLNLERSTARRASFESGLSRLGLGSHYRRFPAIDGASLPPSAHGLRAGEVGCFHSHMRALEVGRGVGAPLHILEDDALLSARMGTVIAEAAAARLFEHFDIVLTDMLVDCHVGLLKFLKPAFDKVAMLSEPHFKDFHILDLGQQNFSCLTSYVVAPRAADRILELYRQEIASGPRLPADLFIRNAVHAKKLRAACLFPFLTSFDLAEVARSTIAGDGTAAPNASVMALAVLRYSFFLERDLDAARATLDAAFAGAPPPDPHAELIDRTVGFVLSDGFKQF